MSKEEILEGVLDPDLYKIRKMYMSDDAEDKEIAYQWLCKLIGQVNADANLFVLTFYKDWEDDSDVIIDENNYWKMNFKTYPIGFGKDYRYRVEMSAKYKGEKLINTSNDYSRRQVGDGDPKWDFSQLLCDKFRAMGVKFYPPLFHNQHPKQ